MKTKIRKIRKKATLNHRPRLKAKLWLLSHFSQKAIQAIRVGLWVLATLVLMVLVYTGERTGMWFKASILEAPQPFNGTTMPVTKVPNWTHWMNGKPDMTIHYDQIPDNMLIDLPAYDLTKMQYPDDKLVWGNASQDDIRNVKITYPVVYLGDYKYDHLENVGSHLAVDIKVPLGTPVHAVANGKVVTVSMDSTGFGHHVVVQHTNVPDPDNPGIRITLYSCYDHLSDINVAEGENVLKGEVIAKSGDTGTSTTPHLHFQMDRDTAPWHPYWPFTTQDEVAAKLSFFDAVSAGLGIDKARLYTVNPMKYVTQNLGSYTVATAGDVSVPQSGTSANTTSDANVSQTTQAATTPTTTTTTQATTPQPTVTPATTPATETQNPTVVAVAQTDAAQTQAAEPATQPAVVDVAPVAAANDSGLFEYKITGENVSLLGNAVPLIVTDEKGQVSTLKDDDVITASVDGQGKLLKKQFTKADFVNGILKLYVKSDTVGTANVMIGKSAYQVNFVDSVNPVSAFRVETPDTFQKGVPEQVKVVALDENGNLAAGVNFSGYVEIKATQGAAELTPNMLDKEDFKGGTATVSLVSNGIEPIVLRAQNGALVGVSDAIHPDTSEVFTDIKPGDPNYDAIKYLKDEGVVDGYSDGTFRPSQVVNRVEALKMMLAAFKIDTVSSTKIDFKDTDAKAWYAPLIAAAMDRGIVAGYADGTFKPSSTVNRAEYLKILFKAVGITPDTVISQPYKDVPVSIWYAPYAYMADKMNLLQPSEDFNPSDAITRAGVAETIYRMKMIKANGWVTYAK
jgi:Peptidase family M23/S-layer homology domain